MSAQDKYKHIRDRMGRSDKEKLKTLAHELLVEAKYKIHQTDALRDQCSQETGFQVGMVIGQIREKYKTMLELYRQTKNKHSGKSKLMMPAVEKRRPIHYFVRMEYISSLEIDIDRLVHILETTTSFKHIPKKYRPKH